MGTDHLDRKNKTEREFDFLTPPHHHSNAYSRQSSAATFHLRGSTTLDTVLHSPRIDLLVQAVKSLQPSPVSLISVTSQNLNSNFEKSTWTLPMAGQLWVRSWPPLNHQSRIN